MLKTTVSSQMLVINKVFATNEVDGIKDCDKLIEKCEKLSKTGKLSKSKIPHLISAMRKYNFLTSDTKTDFRF